MNANRSYRGSIPDFLSERTSNLERHVLNVLQVGAGLVIVVFHKINQIVELKNHVIRDLALAVSIEISNGRLERMSAEDKPTKALHRFRLEFV